MGMSPVTGFEVSHTLRKLEQHVGTIANQMKLAETMLAAPAELVECVSAGGWSEQDSAQLKRIADVLERSLDRALFGGSGLDLSTLSEQGLRDVLKMVLYKIRSRERETEGLSTGVLEIERDLEVLKSAWGQNGTR